MLSHVHRSAKTVRYDGVGGGPEGGGPISRPCVPVLLRLPLAVMPLEGGGGAWLSLPVGARLGWWG